MIRVPISASDLTSRIEAEAPGWLERARTSQQKANASKHVGKDDGIWSEVKAVYMTLQGFKCMYCEKPMPKPDPQADGASGKVEYDVEHFRPKNRVSPWPPPKVKARRHIDYQVSNGLSAGYVWLAFDPLNYGVSCKTCNSELKGDRFPILGAPGTSSMTLETLEAKERPCLVLPVGDRGVDPEMLLTWAGPLVAPKAGLAAEDELRAKVLIDFFELDTRRDLIEGRCAGIMLVFEQLQKSTPRARRFVERLTADDALFAGCLRSFVALFKKKPAEAKRWFEKCEDYLTSRGTTGLEAP